MRDRKRRKESGRQIERHRVIVREATKQAERQTDMQRETVRCRDRESCR